MDQLTLIKMLTPPTEKVDMVLDTDAYNEIDDQFAIAYALKSTDKLEVKALYAAPFFNSKSTGPKDGMEKSYDEIKKIVTLAGRTDMISAIYRGSENYLPDEKTPVESEAMRDLIDRARKYTSDNPLYVVAIGAITNVASAIIAAPDIIDKIVIVWLGGHSWESDDTHEFNMFQDVAAARVIFGCGAPLVQLPCGGVVSSFYTTKPELEYWLVGKNPLADYIAKNAIAEAESYAAGRVWSRVIWDVTAIAYLTDRNGKYLQSRLDYAPIPEYDDHYSFDRRRHMMRYVYGIRRDALMGDLFNSVL
ncbi:MAG: nucleoside hydrolase [Clostridiales bacterium]|nr:nucleoside hydrolase [Clostridiales bacterium]